ncbi:MAG: hypothetical protein ACYS32_09190, partial [Planctomycetota bacterium]
MKRFAIIFLLLGLASLIQGQDDHSPYGDPTVGYLRTTDGYTALYHPVYQVPLWVAYKVKDYAVSAPTISTSGSFKKDTFDPPLPDWAMLVNAHYTMNRPGLAGDKIMWDISIMGRRSRYSPEVRERAVRMVEE